MSVNKVILVGNVGADPEVKHLDSGTTLCNFSLATNEVYKKNGEKVKNTEWHRIVLWRKLAEVAEQYVNKGDMLYIEGKIKTRSYEDKEGNQKYITEIQGDNMTMLGNRQSSASSGENNSTGSGQQQDAPKERGSGGFEDMTNQNEDDDLPF